jgi:hypothetical protein
MTMQPKYLEDYEGPARDGGPCWTETAAWRDCVDEHLKSKNVKAECDPCRYTFDKCVGVWRAKVGPDAKIKGPNPGEPPRQCATMSYLVQKCLVKTQYNHIQCDRVMQQFKHCVKGLYGAEFISD